MIAAWMCFAIVVGACFVLAALAAERVAVAVGRPVRVVWIMGIVAMVVWPAVALLHASGANASSAASALLAPITIGVQRVTALVAGVSTSRIVRALDAALLVGWAALSAICLAHLVRAMRTLARQRDAWPSQWIDGMRVRISSDIGPAVVGLDPMEIVLPEWTLALDRPLRALVLRHEHEHRRARDPYVLFASALAVALMPWNAALWWGARRLRLAVELDCDARVLRAHPRPERYGLLLLTIAQRQSASATRFAPALSEPSSNLERRIIAMRRTVARISRVRVLLVGAAAVAAIILACSVPTPDKATGPEASANHAATPAASSKYFSFQIDQPAMPKAGNPRPAYPAKLEQAHVGGDVLVAFVVNETGTVDMSTFKVFKATDPLFVDAVRSVLGSWKFTPAEAHGHAVRQLMQIPFAFRAP